MVRDDEAILRSQRGCCHSDADMDAVLTTCLCISRERAVQGVNVKGDRLLDLGDEQLRTQRLTAVHIKRNRKRVVNVALEHIVNN